MEQLHGIPYRQRDVEKEANNIAEEALGRDSEFGREIISFLTSNAIIDNENLPDILKLHDR